ncbi:MAG: glycosyltransferase family 4 protein [Pseudonocardiaceae bacterium]
MTWTVSGRRRLVGAHVEQVGARGPEEQCLRECSAPAERANLLREGARTRSDELTAWRRVRVVGAVSDEDAEAIRTAVPDADVRCLPNGADHLGTESGPLDTVLRESARLLFISNLGYEPNLQAVRLLLADIFPQVLRRCPDATLAIVGSDPPEWLVKAAGRESRVTVTGWVPDVAPWLDAAHVVVCPLAVGGGVKVKVLEALARGCAVTPGANSPAPHMAGSRPRPGYDCNPDLIGAAPGSPRYG